jgi:parvulin-like peptidyl-prolyl isomerase
MISSHTRRLLCFLLLFALVLPCNARAIDRTIAKINDTILTESDLAGVIAEIAGMHHTTGIDAFGEATSETVTSMLDRALLLQEARRLKISPPETELHRQVEGMVREIKDNFASEKEFYQALAEERLSLEQLKDQLLKQVRDDFMVYHVVDSRFSLSDEELKAAKAEGGVSKPASYRLRRLGIAITKKLGAEEACKKARATVAQTITEGITFEEGIRRFSQVPGAAQDGGDMGYVSADSLSEEVRKAVEGLDVGQASAPVVAGGYANVFYVEGKRGERVALREEKFLATRDELLASLRRRAVLQVFDDRLSPFLIPEYSARVTGRPSGEPSPSTSKSATPARAQSSVRSVSEQADPAGQIEPTPSPQRNSSAPQQHYAPAQPAQYQQPYATPTPTPGPRPFWGGWGRR